MRMDAPPSSWPPEAVDERSLAREWPWYDDATVAEASRLVRDGRVFDYGHGPELAELEAAFAERHGRTYALALNSGTSALFAAFFGLNLQRGDEVIVPTFTFLASASPLLVLGAVPILADSGDATGNATAQTIAPLMTARTRAIVITHLFGEPVDIEPVQELARRHGVAVIEDCSHAHGACSVTGRQVGTCGDVAVYSIGGLKPVSGGLGGVLLTDNEDVYDTACLLSSFKQRSSLTIRRAEVARLADVGLGGNLRISPVAAVLAKSHLDRLPGIVATKQRNARVLEDALSELRGVRHVATAPGADRGGRYGVHVAYAQDATGVPRSALLERLVARGLRVKPPRTQLLHRSSLFQGHRPPRDMYDDDVWRRAFSYSHNDFPVASSLHDSWIELPGTRLHGDADDLIDVYVRVWTETWAEFGLV